MTRLQLGTYLVVFFFLNITFIYGQKTNLGDYHYVIVPNYYQFLNSENEYQLNEMTKFYLEKNGFIVFFANENPGYPACEGLQANVEKQQGFMGTKLQIVLSDCNGNEVYRSVEGRSRLKDFERAYQDALRNAFKDFPEVAMQSGKLANPKIQQEYDAMVQTHHQLPTLKTYVYNNKTFILRKTAEGFSFYQEDNNGDLHLAGKIINMGNFLKYLDVEGNSADVNIDNKGNLIIETPSEKKIYVAQ